MPCRYESRTSNLPPHDEPHLSCTAEFLITSLIVVLIPGTGLVFTISTGLAQGRAQGVITSIA